MKIPKWLRRAHRPFDGDARWARDYPPLVTSPPRYYEPEEEPMNREWTSGDGVGDNAQAQRVIPQSTLPSVHDQIAAFRAPALPPSIGEAWRVQAEHVRLALDDMLAACEEARREGLELMTTLIETGEWQERFVADYVSLQRDAAAAMRDTWRAQLEDLKTKNAVVEQAIEPRPEPKPEGEQT